MTGAQVSHAIDTCQHVVLLFSLADSSARAAGCGVVPPVFMYDTDYWLPEGT